MNIIQRTLSQHVDNYFESIRRLELFIFSIKRQFRYLRRYLPVADLYFHFLSRLGVAGEYVSQADAFPDRRGVVGARHGADLPVLGKDAGVAEGDLFFHERKSCQPALSAGGLLCENCLLADEFLFQIDKCAEASLERVSRFVNIVTVHHVAHFGAKDTACSEATGGEA